MGIIEEITTEAFHDIILKGNCLDTLECIVSKERERYNRLRKQIDKTDFEGRIQKSEIKWIIEEVKGHLSHYFNQENTTTKLRITPDLKSYLYIATSFVSIPALIFGITINKDILDIPSMRYISGAIFLGSVGFLTKSILEYDKNSFNQRKNKIKLHRNDKITFTICAIEEFIHSYQLLLPIFQDYRFPKFFVDYSKDYSAFVEGHAAGLREIISKKFSKIKKNKAYEFKSLEVTLPHLEETLVSMKASPKTRLVPSDIGYSIFKIAEVKYGIGIYKRVLQGDFGFIKSLGS